MKQSISKKIYRCTLQECSFFNLIEDGQWHRIEDLAKELNLPSEKIVQIITCLAKAKLIDYNEKTKEVKLQEWIKNLPALKCKNNSKHSIGTLILPRDGGSAEIQGTTIHNNSNLDLELDFLIENGRIKEININNI